MSTHAATTPLVATSSHSLLDAVLVAVADAVHARGDAHARAAGWTVTRVGRTGRSYRAPGLDELAARRLALATRTAARPSVIA